ncbi:CubicO group peptidase, beta-lactamase class C family [Chitinophaga sp. YR573]|uniref:serine hydrolase n=1 Tax=Chitinophaga sp. YR573 TaxID=1881040 RepID=UPI0008BB3706|nr:serine hydrolase [Chitinophaga sp. YR573]SEW44006.1 CubicO group peptidase, beta-lactamase class C family [Chitinophaga sp. YR573]
MSQLPVKTASIFILGVLFCLQLSAHNGKVAYAYPLGKINVDGDLSDWPPTAVKYLIKTNISDTKPNGDADFSGFFQLGYRMENHSLYIAFTITDNDFVEDTTENVRWNTQDALQLSVDARHLPFGSGVASFMYSKKLRNIDNAFYDSFAKNASWDMTEVAFVRKGNKRYYEWRISLGDQLAVNKSIGFDFLVFDKDTDNSFSFTGWGKGEAKYRNPKSLGDVIFLAADEKLATVSGNVSRDKPMTTPLPGEVHLHSVQNPKLWVATDLDSSGNYSVEVPAGKYELLLPYTYFQNGKNVYALEQKKPTVVLVRTGQKNNVPRLTISSSPIADLIPEKGILHQFGPESFSKIDHFIETYQKYYQIPGVSLALIKDGGLVYYKTYGVRNTFTGEKVDENTLFEAASVTKPVFAFAVQRLAERGVIDLDKPLYLYLPYADIEYDERYKLMTARHVLTHRTGFPNWRSMNENGKLNLLFTPGTDYNYSGEGFEYLKKVIEKITGEKVEQVLQEEVVKPIGLYHTFFSRNDSLKHMAANGHYDMLPTYDELPESPGMAYSMYTEARIFTKFMLYLLDQKGLSAETYQTMFQKHSDFHYKPGDKKPRYPAYMGESLEIRETPFGKSFGHGGNNGDFKCHFEVYKDLKMGYVIFTNSNTSDALLDALRDFLVEGKENE